MINRSNFYQKLIFLFVFTVLECTFLFAQNARFTVVIDPGHGGNDPGALGRISKEKDINLAVALELGKLIAKEHKDVKVVYTRKTDVFIPLRKRADIANENHADLFISIHANSAQSRTAYGTETYVLGLTNSKSNLDVAMRENSVILLESDYKTQYKGFDPSSVDSYIMFEFMQDKFIDRSIEFASFIQNEFTNSVKRHNRGVRQAGFWVLHATAAPSVLIELGFISNGEEEKFLASKSGQGKLAKSVFDAFCKYKHNHDKRSGKPTELSKTDAAATNVTNASSNVAVSSDSLPVFKIQFMVSKTKLDSNNNAFKGLDDIDFYFENDYYKYTTGRSSDYNTMVEVRNKVQEKHKDAFIVVFFGEKKIAISEALNIINQQK